LHKKELVSLAGKIATLNLTLVPISLYNKGNIFKVEIALARGKKQWDKRETIKKREQEREIEKHLNSKF
jgi:SsrA-binding protein